MIRLVVLLAACVAVCSAAATGDPKLSGTDKRQNDIIKSLARQLILQQLATEERIRTEGDSGIKQVRFQRGGTRSYHSSTWATSKVASVHDHANNARTVGLGEFSAVLNGVEFRTRHNDYGLRMPSTTSKDYHKVQDIPYPGVPFAVKNKTTVAEQITEMREWFKAWKNQDHSVRDYRNYFKANLCYMEGAWTMSGDGKIEESFTSDRHFIDASSWFELQEKIRYTAFSGRKSGKENLAYLPSVLWEVKEDGTPVFAQWNYRILCQPLKDDLPLNLFRPINDLGARMSLGSPMARHASSRAARFQLNPRNIAWGENSEGPSGLGLMDKLMGQIPGKDNHGAKLIDNAMGDPAYPLDSDSAPINTAYYHRYFQSFKKGAMGLKTRVRGYADQNMWSAMTTQPKVAATRYTECRNRVCTEVVQRWTYAIPLEIVYMTPLYRWNPYDIEYKGVYNKNVPKIKTVYAGPKGALRTGRLTADLAYNGTHSKIHIRTPIDFYSGKELMKDPADTTRSGAYGVLDRSGTLRMVRASGTRVFMPNIAGVGILRTRYPIMPVHAEGNSIWKEVDALKDIVMDLSKYSHMLSKPPSFGTLSQTNGTDTFLTFELPVTVRDPPGEHSHMLTISQEEDKELKSGKSVTVTTTIDNGHAHKVTVIYIRRRRTYLVKSCDNMRRCWDGHSEKLIKVGDAEGKLY